MSPTLFGIYNDKLEGFLEEASCFSPTFTGIVIILPLCVDVIVLMASSPYDLDKKLKILKDFCSTMGMTVNNDKTKVMIIKSKNITYIDFVYMTTIDWRK
jgi:hypothetical protein